MNMDVALGAYVITVIRDSPAVAPFFLGFLDGFGPQVETGFGRQIGDSLHAGRLLARKGEQTIGLLGIRVGQKENLNIRRLFGRDLGEAALARVQSFGELDVAGT